MDRFDRLNFLNQDQQLPIKVLIVDQNQQDRSIYRYFIESDLSLNYQVLEAETVEDAIATWTNHRPDIVLLNIGICDGNGIQVWEAIAKSAPDIPVILLRLQGDPILPAGHCSATSDYLIKEEISAVVLRRSIYRTLSRISLFRQLQRSQQQEKITSEIALHVRKSLNLEQIYQAIVKEVKTFLNADRTVIYKFNANMSGTIIAESVDEPWTASIDLNIVDTCFRDNLGGEYRNNKIFIANDIYQANLSECHIRLLERFQVKANLVVPILLPQKVEAITNQATNSEEEVATFLWGLLVVHQCRSTRNWRDIDLHLLQRLSVQLAIAIHQAELYQNVQILNQSLEEKVKQRTAELLAQELKLRQSQQLLQVSFDNAPVGMAILDLEGKFLAVNQNLCKTYGYTAAELLQKSAMDITHPKDQKLTLDSLARLLNGEIEQITIEKKYIHKNGNLVDAISRITLIHDLDRHPVQFVVSVEDITERKQNEAKLDAARAAEAANKAKSEFLAAMSHELRTPMNAVIGMSELLSNTELNDQQQKFISTIRHGGEVLLSVINKVLDFSQIESGTFVVDSYAFDLHQLIDEILDLMAAPAGDKSLELSAFLDLDVPRHIISDYNCLQQILVNLIGNAIKFTKSGEVAVKVSSQLLPNISESQERQYQLIFEIRDTGIGIDAELIHRLFKPFSQADTSITRQYGGTGLGLAICKHLCELMGGNITVDSQVGKGTVFRFNILAQAAHSNELEDMAMPLELAHKRMLIVSSQPSICQIVEVYAQQLWKMSLHVANSILEGLQLLSIQEFDVVVIDQNIHTMHTETVSTDNHEVMEFAQSIYDIYPDLPIILLTSIKQNWEIPQFIKKTIIKPCTPSKLYFALLSAFGIMDQAQISQGSLLNVNTMQALQMKLSSHSFTQNVNTQNVNTNKDTQQNSAIANEANEASEDIDSDFAKRFPFKILVVEDNIVNQQILLLMLERLGYASDRANNGLEALELIKKQNYDLVFMDIQMPIMDGLNACQKIRDLSDRNPWIVGLSAHAFRESREEALSRGMNDYITKPLQLEQLTQTLHKLSQQQKPIYPIQPSNSEIKSTEFVNQQAATLSKEPIHTGLHLKPIAEELFARDRQSQKRDITPYGIYFQVDFTVEGLEIIDLKSILHLEEYLGKTAMAEIVESYLVESEKMIARMHEALMVFDFEGISLENHALKGGCATIGALRLSAVCNEISRVNKSSLYTNKVKILEALLQKLDVEFARADQFLRDHVI
ncbi:MAG: response regulator [Pseudanabaenaceae cyanobacterium bins.39]|nr:response regulator [Pseudanabaenaceae cyanobacterium bins.39]